MEVETESVKLLLSNGLTKIAHSLSMEAHKQNQPFITNTKKHGASSSSSSSSSSSKEVSIFAFSGSWEVNEWFDDDYFGETNVDSNLLPSLRRIGENKLAKVNKAFLKKFQDLLTNSKFKTEVEKAVNDGKKILFTGHSYGGAIASFATLWMLDEYVKKHGKKIPIGCVTFGSPLIGDRTLSHAVRREKWTGHFTHFVMEYDIIPRMMLAPKISIQEHLDNILKFFQQKDNPIDHKPHKTLKLFKKSSPRTPNVQEVTIKSDKCVEFFENVMMNASTVASHVAFELMEPTNALMEKLTVDYVKVSPYRPSGSYVFCTSPFQQFVVENPNVVLQLLFYFLQLADESQSLPDFAVKSLTENFSYEDVQSENLIDLKNLKDHLLTPKGTAGDLVRTSNKALFDLTASARCCIIAADEAEKRKKENEDVINKSMRRYKLEPKPVQSPSNRSRAEPKFIEDILNRTGPGPEPKPVRSQSDRFQTEPKIIEDILDEIRNYKVTNPDYYEAFKLQNDKTDFQANINRLELAKIWDVIVEMVMREDLPDEFEGRKEWVEVGTAFRRLVEPLDIANYYRHLKGNGYIDVRPKRYKFTQRWYEHENGTGFEVVSESNFVAEVEEIKKEFEETKKKTVEKIKEEVKSVDLRIQKWRFDVKIPNGDVFWGESILSILKEKLP